ncbi:MAG TPA: phosphoribosylformylglycinamidine synthase subunit PurQ [Hyphomicrobiaceae bacterium]|jgi:phosphoribosylformylglycinamidine synthase|nr:phosphoribosylformylglycinamidine synthase subunit PurQ [Hyphomicrobiaceae bacterium]
MKAAVIVFPGSNCDRDVKVAIERVIDADVSLVWHADAAVPDVDAIVLPGGFAYGDYLRTGAMAAHSHVMRDIVAKAKAGTPVIGICNGFQVLCEAGLLPGVLMRNASLKYVCRDVWLKVEQTGTPFTGRFTAGETIRLPVGHGEGNYYADAATLDRLEAEGRVVFRYVDEAGNATVEANPNGSQRNIAGICDKSRRVVGLMPHPERLIEPLLGGIDGRKVFESLLAAVAA